MPRPAAPTPRRNGSRPRYEPDDLDGWGTDDWENDDWDNDEWDNDEWGRDDDWDFDDEPYNGAGRGRRRSADSWETGDADYI